MSFNIQQIMTLVNAGYTKADIDAMQDGSSSQTVQPAEEQSQPDAVPAANPEPAQVEPQPAASSQAQQTDDPYTRLEAKLNQLIGLQQMQNINASIPAGQQNQRSVADILGEVIAPPRKDIKK